MRRASGGSQGTVRELVRECGDRSLDLGQTLRRRADRGVERGDAPVRVDLELRERAAQLRDGRGDHLRLGRRRRGREEEVVGVEARADPLRPILQDPASSAAEVAMPTLWSVLFARAVATHASPFAQSSS